MSTLKSTIVLNAEITKEIINAILGESTTDIHGEPRFIDSDIETIISSSFPALHSKEIYQVLGSMEDDMEESWSDQYGCTTVTLTSLQLHTDIPVDASIIMIAQACGRVFQEAILTCAIEWQESSTFESTKKITMTDGEMHLWTAVPTPLILD